MAAINNVNNVTTYFVGNYYEVTGSTVTKYYYAGSQRVAMRTYDTSTPGTSTLNFLLSDHLGSTSITTDSSGNVIQFLRSLNFPQPVDSCSFFRYTM
ncbi:MAG: hypothetical protein HZB19_09785 [Chloroflexi bacterium]|nr:hypothetical protein [Chloroflexota bacterium]